MTLAEVIAPILGSGRRRGRCAPIRCCGRSTGSPPISATTSSSPRSTPPRFPEWSPSGEARKSTTSRAAQGDDRKGARAKPVKEVSPARVNRSVTEPLRKVLYFARDTLGQHIQPIKWKAHILKEPAERIRVMKAEQEEAILAALPAKYHPAGVCQEAHRPAHLRTPENEMVGHRLVGPTNRDRRQGRLARHGSAAEGRARRPMGPAPSRRAHLHPRGWLGDDL